jgi:hypothetical protein
MTSESAGVTVALRAQVPFDPCDAGMTPGEAAVTVA